MIEQIREQAQLIHERLWCIATAHYGLEQTPEAIARIQATWAGIVHQESERGGFQAPNTGRIKATGQVDECLALAFLILAGLERESDQNEALAQLVLAAEIVGMLSISGPLQCDLDAADQRPLLEKLKNAVATSAKAMARRRHREHHDLAADAVAYWQRNIDPSLSAQKAASILESIVPLSHKKLAALVAAEKKKPFRLRIVEPVRKE